MIGATTASYSNIGGASIHDQDHQDDGCNSCILASPTYGGYVVSKTISVISHLRFRFYNVTKSNRTQVEQMINIKFIQLTISAFSSSRPI